MTNTLIKLPGAKNGSAESFTSVANWLGAFYVQGGCGDHGKELKKFSRDQKYFDNPQKEMRRFTRNK
jgi:hypothetical protein